jgi:enoyl-CoA hydratase
MSASLSTDRIDQLLVISVTRTHPGALPETLCAAGLEVIETLQSQSDIGAVLLVLSPPADAAGPADASVSQSALQALDSWVEALAHAARPLIAVLEGNVDAALTPLALACPMRIAAQHGQWQAPQPGGGISTLLADALPPALAHEWLLRRAALSAQRLHAAGVVNLLAAEGQVLQAAIDWAGEFPADAQQGEALLGLMASARTATLAEQQAAERRALQRAQIAALRSAE